MRTVTAGSRRRGAHWPRANEGTSVTATAMNRHPSMAPAKKTSHRSCSIIVGQISLMTKARCSSAGRGDPMVGHWIGETIERAKKGMRLRVRFFQLASAELVSRALLSGTNAFAPESSAREFGIDEDCWACECQTRQSRQLPWQQFCRKPAPSHFTPLHP